MRNITYIILALTIVLSACVDDPNLAEKGIITDFRIPDQRGFIGLKNIKFDITQPADEASIGTITNNGNLFPFASLEKTLIPDITAEGYQRLSYQLAGNDSIYFFNSSPQIDFSGSVLLSVLSENGQNLTTYRINIQASQINPNRADWEKIHDSIPVTHYSHTKSFYLNNKLFLATSYIDPVSNTADLKLYSSPKGEIWSEESNHNFPTGIHHSICVLNNVCYIIGYVGWDTDLNQYQAKHEIWSSSDGINWSSANYPDGMTGVLKNTAIFDGKMYVWGGSGINNNATTDEEMLYGSKGEILSPDRTTWEFSGSQWVQKSNMPDEMPVRFSTATKYQDRLQVYGGETVSGEFVKLFWSLIGRDLWYNIPKSDLSTYKGASLVNYDNNLWLIGGEGTNGLTSKTVQFSDNGGVNFNDTTFTFLSEVMPPYAFKGRKNHSVILNPENQLFILGGISYNESNGNPEKTELHDLWSIVLNKFKSE